MDESMMREPDHEFERRLPGYKTGADSGAKTGQFIDTSVPPAERYQSQRELRASDRRSVKRRQFFPLTLFIATCLSTFWAGATSWSPHAYLAAPAEALAAVETHWQQGLAYMFAVISILLMHEMGHFLQTVRYHVPASWPLFLPLPILPFGTMGAVIVMDPGRANRRHLFDIGISGPWAGLLVALPIIVYGIMTADPQQHTVGLPFGTPLVFKLIAAWLRPEMLSTGIPMTPPLMAGWVGMLITGLNMLPVSQLDGGHVIYGLFGPKSKLVARAFIIAAIGFIVISEQYGWILMLLLVLFLGVDHPPTHDDSVRLGPVRWTIGLLSLAIPVLCFTPVIVERGF